MGDQITVEDLFRKYIDSGNHNLSDYFGLIRNLVAQRQQVAPESPEHKTLQQTIDSVYELVENEILTNQGVPVATVKFGTSGWRGILGKDLFVKSVGMVTEGIVAMYRQLDSAAANDSEYIEALGVQDFNEAKKTGLCSWFRQSIRRRYTGRRGCAGTYSQRDSGTLCRRGHHRNSFRSLTPTQCRFFNQPYSQS